MCENEGSYASQVSDNTTTEVQSFDNSFIMVNQFKMTL